MTYKTHPNPSHIQVGIVQFNVTDESARRTILEKSLQTIPEVTNAGYTGYGYMGNISPPEDLAFQAIFLQPNATNGTFDKAFEPFYQIAALPGVKGQIGRLDFPSWMDYSKDFLTDPNIATNIIDGSRLLNSHVLLERTKDLVDLMFEYPNYGPGFNFSRSNSQFTLGSRMKN